MFIDSLLQVSAAEAVASTEASDDYIDLKAAGDAIGHELTFVCRVHTAFTTGDAATLSVALQTDDNSSFSSPTTLAASGVLAVTAIDAVGDRPLVVKVGPGLQRYVRAYYTVGTGSFTNGKVDAFLVKDIDLSR